MNQAQMRQKAFTQGRELATREFTAHLWTGTFTEDSIGDTTAIDNFSYGAQFQNQHGQRVNINYILQVEGNRSLIMAKRIYVDGEAYHGAGFITF